MQTIKTRDFISTLELCTLIFKLKISRFNNLKKLHSVVFLAS
jgi:hypothetical protein